MSFPLVEQILSAEESDQIFSNLDDYIHISIQNREQKKDIQNIINGVYSPLTGFLREADFQNVVENMRLQDGSVWSIPITFDVSNEQRLDIGDRTEVLIVDENQHPIALVKNLEIYSYDPEYWAMHVFKTNDKLHPGVEYVYEMQPYLLGGDVYGLSNNKDIFPEHNFTPAETRKIFRGRGWNHIVAFQTRNIPHRGHEFLQHAALKEVDGLFIQPVIGEKKLEDFKDEYIIKSYEVLIEKYFPKNKVVLGILPLKMRYGGPREAVFHALIRRNYGCTHFIVGRDHAGVGNYYGPYDAQEIFEQFEPEEIGIEIMKFPEVVLCKTRQEHCFITECPDPDNQIHFSGTKLRNLIKEKQEPPSYIIRPEVYAILTERKNVLVDDFYKRFQHRPYDIQEGFVLWFTGFSQSGKSTIADRLYEILEDKGIRTELLDGDVVRESLTKDLGFSKEDRDANIQRVGFVAKLLARNHVAVIASFISPYKIQRDGVRMKVKNFIEVYVNTPLEVCERWDQKGFYAKARAGEIGDFTGISAPYEAPESPEIELRPAEQGVDECVEVILQYLEENRFI